MSRAGEGFPDAAVLLTRNVRLVHGRDTCDEAGRPLSTYTCDYHQGFEDGIEEMEVQLHGHRLRNIPAGAKHRWTRHADYECWCGGWHSLGEAWRLNRGR